MSGELRIILIAASVITCFYISRKLKKSQVAYTDMVFWLLFSGLLIIISIFPGIMDWFSRKIGIYSPQNAVFLVIIFALLLRVFLLTVKISKMEQNFKELVEELGIRETSEKRK